MDTNADHLAAWRLDAHGNPCGEPRRFFFDLSGPASYRDAQVRHALIRLLHWAARHGLNAGIGPPRPDTAPEGVRNAAPVSPDHGHDPMALGAERKRPTSVPNTVRGTRLSMGSGNRTHSRSVLRNGDDEPGCGGPPVRRGTVGTI
ncbi:hypothetical protein ACFV2X_19630 [Streptomyces sp. NPDC059679]|uniref:hypothetical protein n=1 Tax=Streptomyces sp. NPDC059679 TaxID=3346903 RepID=UPI0036A06DAB